MSTNAAAQNKIETSIRNVPLKLIVGMVLIVMSVAWLLSLIIPGVPTASGQSGNALSVLRDSIMALSGVGCWVMCVLLLWGGILALASAYHPVSRRGFFVVFLFFLFLTAAIEILSVYDGVDFINYIKVGRPRFFEKLTEASDLGKNGYGFGVISFLIAWPLYSVSKIFGFIVALLLSVIFLFVFFRTNPVRVFEKISNGLDAHQRKKAEKAQTRKTQEGRDALPQQQETAHYTVSASTPPAYASQPVPVYRPVYMNGTPQQVYDYEPEPYDDGNMPSGGAAVEAPAPMEEDFWGPSDPYPAGDPAYAQPAEQPVSRPVSQPASRGKSSASAYADPAPAAIPTVAYKAQMSPSAHREEPVREDDTVSDDGTYDLYGEDAPEDVSPLERLSHPAEKPVRKPSVSGRRKTGEEEKSSAGAPVSAAKTPDVTAAVVSDEKSPVITEEPDETEDTAPDGWAELVRRRRAEIEKKKKPAADVLKEEPRQVYTDPVMPITGEKIKLNSQSTDVPAAKPSLDGRDKQKASLVQMEMKLNAPYVFPKWEFLSNPTQNQRVDVSADHQRAQDIVDTLASFHIQSEVKQITHGPAITRFALQIAPGVKVSSVTGAANNIGLTLGTNQIRMETPIQGTNYIGIEVPNASVTPVRLREVLDSPEMHNNPNPLLVALGKDIAGTPILCDLSKMPHLLIAGATGSGKSVCINSIVCSLLYRATPEQVRLIMVDPKQVELQVYNGIPHLLTPVVCDPRKASAALNWVVNEMFERYNKFAAAKVRNLSGYNKLKAGTEEVLFNIVVIIDEMADLMEVCRKDVEESVRRLAALARAAGIYLVLATQRPSVDVITGVIKNNIPSRIAFAVSSNTDSRTIIDAGGAEKLVGKGDMLYKPTGAVSQRVQGCFVTDEEVERIAEFVSGNCGPQYDPNIQEQLDSVDEGGHEVPADEGDEAPDEGGSEIDDLLREAIEMAVEDGQTSVSMLQRRLRVGYARAGRLVDEMEKRGIVNKSEGSKPRKTIITREQYLRLLEEEE